MKPPRITKDHIEAGFTPNWPSMPCNNHTPPLGLRN